MMVSDAVAKPRDLASRGRGAEVMLGAEVGRGKPPEPLFSSQGTPERLFRGPNARRTS
jgi:hypothetical protein